MSTASIEAEPDADDDAAAGSATEVWPPLWTPADELVYRRAATAQPPTTTEGWHVAGHLRHLFFSSPRVAVARLGMVVAVVFFVAALPGLAATSSWGNLTSVAGYHLWTTVVIAAIATSVRSVPLSRLLSAFLLGASAAAFAVYLLSGPITDLTGSETPSVWVIPQLEEVAKGAVIAVTLLFARRRLSQPGLIDLGLVGYAVGAGFAFHEDALWGRATPSGFEAPWGLGFPSIVQPDGLFVIGHAGWSALVGIGIGLLVLHWRRPVAAVAGVVLLAVPVLDHMAINSRTEGFDWVKDILFDHRLPAWLLASGFLGAFVIDRITLRSLAERDHLLPAAAATRHGVVENPLARRYALLRYRRYRNAVYFSRHLDRSLWPSPSVAADTPSLRRLARAARLAGLPAVARIDSGWDIDPIDASRARWYTAAGWTPFVASAEALETSPAPGRPEVVARTRHDPPPTWRAAVLWLVGAVVALIVIRLLTVPEDAPTGVTFSLPDAPNNPPRRMFPPVAAGPCTFGCDGPGDGFDGDDGSDSPTPDGDPPPLPPDFFDSLPGEDAPDDVPPNDETDCP